MMLPCGAIESAARRVVEREAVDVVTHLAEGGGRSASGESGTDHDDLEAAAVVRRDQLHVELVLVPPLLDGPAWNLAVEFHR